jgi:hypothetical protein
MKSKLLILPLYFIFQLSFSQTEKTLKGTIKYENFPLQDIEILNLASNKTTKTDTNGQFIILVKATDTLMFISKNYEYKKLVIKKEDFYLTNLDVSLTRKPEELEEVTVITKISFPKIKLDKNIPKASKNSKPIGVYDGTIENGVDFMRIGKTILGIFKKDKENNKESNSKIEFKKTATTICNQDYFYKTLQLKPEEIDLFLEFCDADPKSKIIIKNCNPLILMDFLFIKNIEFKKLLVPEKQ